MKGITWGILLLMSIFTIVGSIYEIATGESPFFWFTLFGAMFAIWLLFCLPQHEAAYVAVEEWDDYDPTETETMRLLQEFRESPYRHGYIEGRWTE